MGGKGSKAGGKAGHAAVAASGKHGSPLRAGGGSTSLGAMIARTDSGEPLSDVKGYSKVHTESGQKIGRGCRSGSSRNGSGHQQDA
jgi:hypothetical protein